MYSNTKTFLIVDLTEHPFGPCQGLTCGQYISCFCVAGNPNKNVTNVPMGTTINTKFLKCIQINGEWIEYELEYYYQLILGDSDVSYQIFARLNESSLWVEVGRMNFTETIPPGCEYCPFDDPEPCVECSTNVAIPTLAIRDPHPWEGYLPKSPCIDNLGRKRISYSVPATQNITDFSIDYFCFDKQTQKWKFKLDNGNIIRGNRVIDFCPQNVPNSVRLVNGFYEIPSGYPCDSLIKWLELALDHFNPHADWPTYMFKPLIRNHEMGHFYIFEKMFKDNYDIFKDLWEDEIIYGCNELPSDLQVVWGKIYKKVFYEYWLKIAIKWRDYHIDDNGNTDDMIEKWIDDTYYEPVIVKYIQDIRDNPQNYPCES